MQGRVLWDQSLPGMTPAERAAIYDEMNRVIAALHTVKFAERGLAELRQAGQLLRAPDRALEQAVRSPPLTAAHPRDGPADRVAARAHSRQRARRDAGVHRAWRLPPRQPDVPSDRAARASRCWTGSCRRSAIRWPTSATTACPGTSRRGRPAASAGSTSRPGHPDRRGLHAPLLRAHRPAPTPRRWRPTGTSTWPTTCSASPPSCRASPSGWRPARRRARRPWHPAAARADGRDGLGLRPSGLSAHSPHYHRKHHGLRILGQNQGPAGPPRTFMEEYINPTEASTTRSWRPTPSPASAGARCRRSKLKKKAKAQEAVEPVPARRQRTGLGL